ncbi:DUF2268 domain-containing protein [Chryseobacterium sp. LC2016-29]|uniref:DUF2268 domain-containing putative Zn-dependent protease n=1 Tax=Chryseobacterium sp. LC2016-29 TaxID=2897331 RepID=UPI001E33684F|nr:DUF2268 domain-containing putative Zn-dependent protease [Chryseobacterium sp. LC2016-29]MCD0480531.1 DUF2268 domain-containing protein [Chryseobacterium sp. LC2016-29]
MQKLLTFLFIIISIQFSFSQKNNFTLNDKVIHFDGKEELNYTLHLKKGNTYLFSVYQENIDIEIILQDEDNKKITSTDLADGNKGFDKLEYTPNHNNAYKLVIKSVSPDFIPNGIIKINVKQLSKKEIAKRKRIEEELRNENDKIITTIDIQNFWNSYDKLKDCKSYQDSLNVIQENYLDRATNGLKEFQKVRYFSSEFFVERIKKYKNFYKSVRNNTLLFSESENFSNIISKINELYPEGKSAKIAFVIGPMSTPGTISNNYLLIGIEMIAGDKNCDLSEITNENLKSDILSRTNQLDVLNFVAETIAHEYIHTQQKSINKNACQCPLLENIIKEGVASYISEKLIMKRNTEVQTRAALYANANEKQLWNEMKAELCSKDFSNWLFNALKSKGRPGDLGYRIGYKIVESFYENSTDKNRAIKDMIEMDNPLLFLDKSKYDLKFK